MTDPVTARWPGALRGGTPRSARRLRTLLLLCAAGALGQGTASAQRRDLTASPNPASPGQAVTIVWHFVGDKILLQGGRFGLGANVTALKSATDHPRKTTRYVVVAWYRPAKDGRPAPPGARQVHVRYEVVVRVEAPTPEPLSIYRDPQGWQVKCPAGWRHDIVRLPDPANNALVFFQKEQDSVERIAVSILPAPDGGIDALMKKLRASVYSSYGDVVFLTESKTEHSGVPATRMEFSGKDQTHPGVATKSMVLAFVKGSRAYLVSARSVASRYAARSTALDRMVRSFALSAR